MSCKDGCNYVELESEAWLILANIVVIYSCSPAIEPAKRGARQLALELRWSLLIRILVLIEAMPLPQPRKCHATNMVPFDVSCPYTMRIKLCKSNMVVVLFCCRFNNAVQLVQLYDKVHPSSPTTRSKTSDPKGVQRLVVCCVA